MGHAHPTQLKNRLRSRYGLLLGLLLPWGIHAHAAPLPDLGSSAAGIILPAHEKQLGLALMRALRKARLVLDDPQLEHYLNQVGQQLAAHLPPGGPEPKFFWVDRPQINAFAGPDGWIGVHTGLLLATEQESELASVLAHEMAHVSQQHFYRAVEQARQVSLPATAALLAAILLGSQAPELGQAAGAALQAGLAQRQINFTREHEYEADFLGMQLLHQSGFAPHAMASFFEKLQERSRFAGGELPEFLRTHPVTPNRITESRARAASLGTTASSNSLGYTLARTRLHVRSQTNLTALAHEYTRQLAMDAQAIAPRYGQVLILQAQRQYADAQKTLATLRQRYPDTVAYRLLEAQLALAQGQTASALRTLTELHLLYPQNMAVSESYLETLLQARQVDTARAVAQALREPADMRPSILRWQARIADAAGQTAQSYAYQAEYSHALGDTAAAVQQLESALRLPKVSLNEQAQLGARLRELKAVLAEIRAEQ